MAQKHLYICDGCDMQQERKQLPDGWIELTISTDRPGDNEHQRSFARHTFKRDLCSFCRKHFDRACDPKQWPRKAEEAA